MLSFRRDTRRPGAVSKTVVRVTVPWVRIPPSPPTLLDLQGFAGLFRFQSSPSAWGGCFPFSPIDNIPPCTPWAFNTPRNNRLPPALSACWIGSLSFLRPNPHLSNERSPRSLGFPGRGFILQWRD